MNEYGADKATAKQRKSVTGYHALRVITYSFYRYSDFYRTIPNFEDFNSTKQKKKIDSSKHKGFADDKLNVI